MSAYVVAQLSIHDRGIYGSTPPATLEPYGGTVVVPPRPRGHPTGAWALVTHAQLRTPWQVKET